MTSIKRFRQYKQRNLKRLYSCNAHYDDYMLMSYDTVVIYQGRNFIYVDYALQTITTKQHIRKFMQAIRHSNEKLYNFLYLYLHNWRDTGRTKLLYQYHYDHIVAITTTPEFETL